MSSSDDTVTAETETPAEACATSETQGSAEVRAVPEESAGCDSVDASDAAELKAGESDVPRGIKWTYREVLRGKSDVILVADVAFFALIILAYYVAAAASGGGHSSSIIAGIVKGAVQLKADEFACNLSAALVILAPLIIVIWPVVALFVMIGLRIRDRNVPRTERNLFIHETEAARAWTWPWSIMVGVFDFTAVFYLLVSVCSPIAENLDGDVAAVFSLLGTLLCLVIAERRVVRVSHAMSAKLPGNRKSLLATLDGAFDSMMEEGYRNDVARAKVATIINDGVVRSPRHAILLVKGVALRTKVKLFSAFLNSMIHGVLAAFSFGIAATVVNDVGAVDGVFASDHGDEYVAGLREPNLIRPHFVVEVAAVIVTTVAATIDILAIAGSLYS